MPEVRAATALAPEARSRNPKRDLKTTIQYRKTTSRPMSRKLDSRPSTMSGIQPLDGIGLVLTFRSLVESSRKNSLKRKSRTARAIELSMIVEITSLTPRFTFNSAAMEAHAAALPMATARMRITWSTAGRVNAAPTTAANRVATLYWPSTPMLNRFILNPMATATAEIISGVARCSIS